MAPTCHGKKFRIFKRQTGWGEKWNVGPKVNCRDKCAHSNPFHPSYEQRRCCNGIRTGSPYTSLSKVSTATPEPSKTCYYAPHAPITLQCSKFENGTSPIPDELGSAAPFPDAALPQASGYLPISTSSQSGLFICFYEARGSPRPPQDTPILLWLNGGPGCSSMIGNFYELGPYTVDAADGKLKRNEFSWNSRYGVIFIDNPIGTGFSTAASEAEIPVDQETCAAHLLFALEAFFTSSPSLSGRPLFLSGESYAGKYVPVLASHILGEVEGGRKLPFSLRGMAVGNGFTDPRTQVQVHAEVMRSFGMLDNEQAAHVEELAREVVALVDQQQWVEAHQKRTSLCDWLEHTAGIPTLLDVRRHAKYHATEDSVEYLAPFLNQPEVKDALKADPSVKWVSCRPALRLHMAVDTMKSYKHAVEHALQAGLPTLLFQGMFDAKDGPLSSERWMRAMHNWSGLADFWGSPRGVWRDSKGRLAGYTREWGNLKHVVLVGAGHQVPADQPENALTMIETWLESQLAQQVTVGPQEG